MWYIFSHMKDFLKVLVYGSLFAVPFLTMFVVNDYFFPFITGKNFAFRILVEIAFVAWALLALIDTKYRPKFSWVLSSFAALLVVMFFANYLGQDPQTSFWSNFERMDGYVTLVHVFLYMVALASMLTDKKHWSFYLNTTLGVSVIVAMYGLAQYSGVVETTSVRIESYLGNAAYMAIYMFFHIFIAFWLFVESRSGVAKVIYALLATLFIFVLIQTGTRGTALGLLAGSGVMVAYMAIFGAKYPVFRRYAIGSFVVLLLGAGTFYAIRDSEMVQSSPNFARIANIDLASDLKVRGTIWGIAWEGVKERPVLGWGQGNFSYIFNQKYDPFLFNQEQWFDRAHNIVMDWLVAGGFLGLIAYFGIFAACLYYLVVLPIRKPDDQAFTVLERGVLIGILAGYMTHNLVVFDNLISYIFFAVVLALIHSRVGEVVPKIAKVEVDRNLINQFFVPVGAVIVVALIYTIHVPGMQAAGDIITAYRSATPADRLGAFKQAINRGSFAHQEITEQISQQAMSMARDENVTPEVRQEFITVAEAELNRLVEQKPGDARVHVFFSTFYRSLGDLEKAGQQMDIARGLSPRKPSIVMQQAIIKYSKGDVAGARDLFKEAFELDQRNSEAREYYATTLFATGDKDGAKALITDDTTFNQFALSDFFVKAVNDAGDTAYLTKLYESRVEQKPEVAQNWASLSFLYYQAKDTAKAIEILKESKKAAPSFSKSAQCFITNMEAGKEPGLGC